MDRYTSREIWWDELKNWDGSDPKWESLRWNLGYIRRLSQRVDLAEMTPRGELCSTGYCLATAAGASKHALIAYQPQDGQFTLDLSGVKTALNVEWLNPADGKTVAGGKVSGGGTAALGAPFAGDAVACLTAGKEANR